MTSRLHRMAHGLRALAPVALVASACSAGPERPYEDHTVAAIASTSGFERLAVTAFGTSLTKFVITRFDAPAERAVRFYDAQFYQLHDEWYWYRLLNGQPVPGAIDDPVEGLRFDTVAEAASWVRNNPAPPLGLMRYEDRVYSERFYSQSFGRDRRFGLGTLLRVPPRNGNPERWAFELEYSDMVTHAELVIFFEMLARSLPPELAERVYFLVRSPDQEALAVSMEQGRLRYHDRILRFRDIVVAGSAEVYSDGITAGRLRVLRSGDGRGTTGPEDVVIFQHIPDLLPPAAGVLTAVPQTPLAHINLLARNRGIPNAFLAGVLDNPELDQLERGYAPVVFYAESPSRVVLSAITEAQYQQYGQLLTRPARRLNVPPVGELPYVIALSGRDPGDTAALAPIIGGKNAGMIALVNAPGVATPDAPQALTIRAYTEHITPLRSRIEAALGAEAFALDARARHLVLEGETRYRSLRTGADDLRFLQTFLAQHGPTSALGSLARNGGIRGLIEASPIAAPTLDAITRALQTVYAGLAPTQGIRFRSSSNVEDIEGFNGAGLYESYTGFFDPSLLPRGDRDKTLARAILRVWGSFWSFEAFEERRLEHIDHISAAMAVLVAPRFDDALERATGVCTLTLLPPGSPVRVQLEVNVQAGAESVANPDPSILPEVDRVLVTADAMTQRVRVRRSTLSPNAELLSDAALDAVLAQTRDVAERWLARENQPRAEAQRARSITLDFEFHDMLAGWPAMRDGSVRAARFVLKQVRTLEPGPRVFTSDAAAWPVPRDVFVRARRVTETLCEATLDGASVQARLLRVQSDPSLPPDVGFAATPLDASLRVSVTGTLTGLGWPRDHSLALDHTQYASRAEGDARRALTVTERARASAQLDSVSLPSAANGPLVLSFGSARVEAPAVCRVEVRYASPRDYLLSLLPGS